MHSIKTHASYLTNLTQDDAITSDFWDMGSNRACEVNSNEMRWWWYVFELEEGGSLKCFFIDGRLPLVWYLKVIFSFGWPPLDHIRGDH